MDSRTRLIGVALATIAGVPSRLPGKAWAWHAANSGQGFASIHASVPSKSRKTEGPSPEFRESGSAGESPGKQGSHTRLCALLGNRHDALNEGLRGLLETMFDAVLTAGDGASLLEGAERLRPDVIVADLALVQSDCLDWIRTLRAKAAEAPLIVITSHEDSNVEAAVRAAGADCVIVKRAIATDLLRAIDHMRARRTLHSPATSPNVLDRS